MSNSPANGDSNGACSMLPTCRIGYVNPLDIIDTCPYEFYRLAPDNAIASFISIGLKGFSGDAAFEAVNANLDHCMAQLAKRQVQVTVLGGLPMLFNLGPDYLAAFTEYSMEKFGLRGVTSVDAVVAALKTLDSQRVVVIDKWDNELNRKIGDVLGGHGIDLIGSVSEVHTADQVKTSFEAGADVALRLAEKAKKEQPDADCFFIAGGAWLVAPYISQIEREFDVSVVAGQQSKIWYSLNLLDNHVDRPEFGRLMSTRMTVPA